MTIKIVPPILREVVRDARGAEDGEGQDEKYDRRAAVQGGADDVVVLDLSTTSQHGIGARERRLPRRVIRGAFQGETRLTKKLG